MGETYLDYYNERKLNLVDSNIACPKCNNSDIACPICEDKPPMDKHPLSYLNDENVDVELEKGKINLLKPFNQWFYEEEHANRFYGNKEALDVFLINPHINTPILLHSLGRTVAEYLPIIPKKIITTGYDEYGHFVDVLYLHTDRNNIPLISLRY